MLQYDSLHFFNKTCQKLYLQEVSQVQIDFIRKLWSYQLPTDRFNHRSRNEQHRKNHFLVSEEESGNLEIS
jgi:hypothetical protein